MSDAPRRVPTLDDVAAFARVSPATVSRYFNNPSIVAEETARRIGEAVATMGYVPNLLAGALASNRSRLVAAFVPDIAQSIFNDMIEAMVDGLSGDGYSVMLGLTRADNIRVPSLVDAALARKADAIILTGSISDESTRARLRERRTTVIETWALPPDPLDVAVGFSHRAVGEEVARFAYAQGYRRPLIAMPLGIRSSARRDGFLARWLELGGSEPAQMIVPTPTSFGQGRSAFAYMRGCNPRPDVVICGSDWLALGLIVEAQTQGLRVPDDVAVIGFGNLALAVESSPTITTVNIDGARIGHEAAAVLRRRAKGEEVPRHIDVGFHIEKRQSA